MYLKTDKEKAMRDIMILNQKFVRFARSFANAALTLLISGSLALGAVATADAQLTNGLLGFWRMDGNGDDSSGNNRPLSLFGNAGFNSGINCRALNLLSNVNQYAAREVDINCDEVVDDADLLVVLFAFGDGC